MRRREFIKTIAQAAALSLAPAKLWAQSEPSRLVVVLLRGGLDGLAALSPLSDPYFRLARPNLCLPGQGQPGAALPLDANYGLHPALASLHDFWQRKGLAFVCACSSQASGLSHRQAQEYLETGLSIGRGGWLSRLLSELRQADPKAQAVSLGHSPPAILAGKLKAPNLSLSSGPVLPGPAKSEFLSELSKLYLADPKFAKTYRQTQAQQAQIMSALEREAREADAQAPSASRFPEIALELSKALAGPDAPRLAALSLGGFDTHIEQGSSQGRLADNLRGLGDGLAILAQTLGPVFQNIVIICLSEFGRSLAENEFSGTDHAKSGLLWLLGPKISGGQILNPWPKLDESALSGHEIEPLTDFREPLSQILLKHLHLPPDAVSRVFPGFKPAQNPPKLMA